MKFHPCKITVLKRDLYQDIIDDHIAEPRQIKRCDLVTDGQTFQVYNPYRIPEGMCESAWADIRSYILAIATGGEFDFMKNPKSAVAICSDPLRPVVFCIERFDNENHITA